MRASAVWPPPSVPFAAQAVVVPGSLPPSAENHTRWPGRDCAASGRLRLCTTAITGYPPVVGWSVSRSIGRPSGGTWIAPGTSPSERSSPARARARLGPSSRSPTRLDVWLTVNPPVSSRLIDSLVNQSLRGPTMTCNTTEWVVPVSGGDPGAGGRMVRPPPCAAKRACRHALVVPGRAR